MKQIYAASLALLGVAAFQAPAVAQTNLDLLLQQNIDIRQRTEINVAPPSVKVDVNLPEPKEGIYGKGKWVEIGTVDMSRFPPCRISPYWCSGVAAVKLDSVSRKGDKISFEYALMPIAHPSRTVRVKQYKDIVYSSLLGQCSKKMAWNSKLGAFAKANEAAAPMLAFACEL